LLRKQIVEFFFLTLRPFSCIGRFQDIKNGIEGACGPVFIHTDRTKTKVKEAEERERQRNGEVPSELKVNKRFTEGFEDSPEIMVATTHSGSMTQEVFYHYVKHFIAALPANHGPVILTLDGHGSRWSVHALQTLIANQVYPFFFASHTSIWAQPNDVGVNKRYHNSIEQIAKVERRGAGNADVSYFNHILLQGWNVFLATEREDLLEVGCNNTTNAYVRTGIYPLNPYSSAWMEAIHTLGLLGEQDELKKQIGYEVTALPNIPELSVQEKALLRDGLMLNATLSDLGDVAVACIRGEELLKKWRMQIVEAVDEGEDIHEYARVLLPASVATNEVELIALKLVEFQRVDVSQIALPGKKTKAEEAHETTKRIVGSTHVTDPIRIAYLSTSDDSEESSLDQSDDDQSVEEQKWLKGSAVKKANNKWKILLEDDTEFMVDESELLDSKKCYVEHAFKTLNREEKKRQACKARRQRMLKQKAREEDLKAQARIERRRSDHGEYTMLSNRLSQVLLSKGELAYEFDEFLAMVDRLRQPFRKEIDGYLVAVSEAGAAVMMQDSAIMVIKDKILGEKRKNDDKSTPNKKQRTSTNNAAVHTVMGANGVIALHHSERRNLRQNKEALDKSIKSFRNEEKYITKTLSMLDDRKKRCELALQKQRQSAALRQEQLEQQEQQEEQQRERRNENNAVGDYAPQPSEIMRGCENLTPAVASVNCTQAAGTATGHSRAGTIVHGAVVPASQDESPGIHAAAGTITHGAVVPASQDESPGVHAAPGTITHGAVVAASPNERPTAYGEAGSPATGAVCATGVTGSRSLSGSVSGSPGTSTTLSGSRATPISLSTTPGSLVATADISAEEYWDIRSTSHREDLRLFLRIFEPTSGVLSKNRGEQWVVIQAKILPQLSLAAMIAKEQYLRRRLAVVRTELSELLEPAPSQESGIST
jgi:hypothetical protein